MEYAEVRRRTKVRVGEEHGGRDGGSVVGWGWGGKGKQGRISRCCLVQG